MKNFLSSVIIFSFFAISCNPEPLVFSGVQGVKLEDVDIQKGNVAAELGLKIKNPNGFSVTVYSVDLDWILAGVSFGTVTLKYEFNFENNSYGGSNYAWDFGVSGTATDVSGTFEPVFTYPTPGT